MALFRQSKQATCIVVRNHRGSCAILAHLGVRINSLRHLPAKYLTRNKISSIRNHRAMTHTMCVHPQSSCVFSSATARHRGRQATFASKCNANTAMQVFTWLHHCIPLRSIQTESGWCCTTGCVICIVISPPGAAPAAMAAGKTGGRGAPPYSRHCRRSRVVRPLRLPALPLPGATRPCLFCCVRN